ncbi:MAG: hypothetical protein A2Y24_02135 [Clostridiales bacterium GWE2_32_10]|nr:MAG: hypothetical protein A2Y24_02135 [Clostridiales bacterium GWE2_32_10]HBY19418.1 hypothetical protein [Clostridiales bacterium]
MKDILRKLIMIIFMIGALALTTGGQVADATQLSISPGESGTASPSTRNSMDITSIQLDLYVRMNASLGTDDICMRTKEFTSLTSYLDYNFEDEKEDWIVTDKEIYDTTGINPTHDTIGFWRTIITYGDGTYDNIYRVGLGTEDMSADYKIFYDGVAINYGQEIREKWSLDKLEEITSYRYQLDATGNGTLRPGWESSTDGFCRTGKSQCSVDFIQFTKKLNVYHVDAARYVLTDGDEKRKIEDVPLDSEGNFSQENTNTNTKAPSTDKYTYLGYKVIYNDGLTKLYDENTGKVNVAFDDKTLIEHNIINGPIPDSNKAAWVCFFWESKNVGTISVRHLTEDGVPIVLDPTVKKVDIPYTGGVAYNGVDYGYSALQLAGYQNTGYAECYTSEDTRPQTTVMTTHKESSDANQTAVPVVFNDNSTAYRWIDFYWRLDSITPILKVVHKDVDTDEVLSSQEVSYTLNQNLSINYDQYSPPDKNLYNYVGYSLYTNPTTKYSGTSVVIDTSKGSNLIYFWWKKTPDAIDYTKLKILYDPPNSTNETRYDWTNNYNVKVYYEKDSDSYRRDPMPVSSTYEINPYSKASQNPETDGNYKKDVTLKYYWSWKEKHVKYTEGGMISKIWYVSKSQTVNVNCIYAGYWTLDKIIASGNALRSNGNIKHNDTVLLNEGKEIKLDAIPGSWDSHAWWVKMNVPAKPSLPSNASGLSGKWLSNTDCYNYFKTDFPEPNKPEWNGDSNPGIYNVDYTIPTVGVSANISDASNLEKITNIAENKWYGGPGYEIIKVLADFSDVNTTSYNVTSSVPGIKDRSGIWNANLIDKTRVFKEENLELDSSVSEEKTELKEHYTQSQVLGPENINTTSECTGEHTARLDVEDFATNKDNQTKVYLLDNIKPTMTYTGAEPSILWSKIPFTIGMQFKDKDSGLNNIEYRLTNENFIGNESRPADKKRDTTASEYVGTNQVIKNIDIGREGEGNVSRDTEIKEINSTISINNDGEYYLYLDKVKDSVGNNLIDTAAVEKGPYKYDGTRPSMNIKFEGKAYANTGRGRIEYIADRENRIDLEVWDNISGIQRVEYAMTKGPEEVTTGWQTAHEYVDTDPNPEHKYINYIIDGGNPYKFSINIDPPNTAWNMMKSDWYYIHFRVTDRAGNVILITGTGATTELALDTVTKIRPPATDRYNAIPIFINKIGPEENQPDSIVDAGIRIADAADPRWKATLEGNKYIPVREMPAYNNQIPHKINLGYKVNFELYSTGFGSAIGDKIELKDRLFIKTANGYKEVRIYLPTDKYASKYKVSDWTKTLTRTTNESTEIGVLTTINPAKEEYMWIYDYYIRPDAKFVKVEDIKSITPTGGAGDTLDISIGGQSKYFIDPKINPDLLVLFEIDVYKYYHDPSKGIDAHLDYTQQENTWGDATDNTSYGNKKPSAQDLLQKTVGTIIVGDPNHGETFWYDLQNTVIDDLDRYTN